MSAVTITDIVGDETNRTVAMRLHPGVTVGQIASVVDGYVDIWTKPEEVGEVPPLGPTWVLATLERYISDASYEVVEDIPAMVLDLIQPFDGEDPETWIGEYVAVGFFGNFPSDYVDQGPKDIVLASKVSKALVTIEHS